MLQEFSKHILAYSGKIFDVKAYHICCLAHIINLAMQALILMHSKSKHFDLAELEANLPADCGFDRDEVGLVWAICVKVWLFFHLISN
ncbi:hypothetical protein L208DRAFT_1277218 [Tricholoma matsutake]|nr:hypothetical protein L208DRAFT_1277218 [Tricholoma matsutake 945]